MFVCFSLILKTRLFFFMIDIHDYPANGNPPYIISFERCCEEVDPTWLIFALLACREPFCSYVVSTQVGS